MAAPADTGEITVTRQSPADAGIRQVVVTCDGQPFGTLLFGQTATRTVSAGRHCLRFDNTLVRKHLEVDIAPGGQARYSVVNRAALGTNALLATLGIGLMTLRVTRDA